MSNSSEAWDLFPAEIEMAPLDKGGGDAMGVDPQESGRIIFAVVKPVEALSLGHDSWLAIPFTALSRDGIEEYYVLNMSREEMRKAPTFDEDH